MVREKHLTLCSIYVDVDTVRVTSPFQLSPFLLIFFFYMNAQVFTTPRIIPNERLFAVGQVDNSFVQ